MSEDKKELLSGTKEWRTLFDEKKLQEAEQFVQNGELKGFYYDEDDGFAQVGMRKIQGRGKWYTPRIADMPAAYSEEWDSDMFHCNCGSRGSYYNMWRLEPCVHEAALMMLVEKQHGPWRFTETEEEMEERLEQERIEQEIERRAKMKEQEEGIPVKISDLFPEPASGTERPFFDLPKIFSGKQTNLYRKNLMEEIEKSGEVTDEEQHVYFGEDGKQILYAEAQIFDGINAEEAEVRISYDRVIDGYCSCERFYRRTAMSCCEHQLVLLRRLWTYIRQENPGDATDLAAERFFELLDKSDIVLEEDESVPPKEKPKAISIVPRISMDKNEAKLSFKVGFGEGKPLILKNFVDFVEAVESERKFSLSKTRELDFSKMDFTEESLPWLTFIQRRVGEIANVNDRLYSKTYYYRRSSSLSVQSQEALAGSTLDRFYDLAENGDCEYQNKSAKINGMIHIGHADMKVRLQTEPISDSAGGFVGIAVTGTMPVILEGVSDSYILDRQHLSRISKEEHQALIPFRKAATAAGLVRFQVGKAKLAEFYYRAVPSLMESRYVEFDDACADLVADRLPPEPQFLFRLDMEGDICICRVSVTYDEAGYRLRENENIPVREPEEKLSLSDRVIRMYERAALGQEETEKEPRDCWEAVRPASDRKVIPFKERQKEKEDQEKNAYHDEKQEARVVNAVRKYFPSYDRTGKGYITLAAHPEEELYRILTEAVPELSGYGEVQGTEAFHRHSIRPVPQVRVGVSIDSGLMDISVISKGIDAEELLDVLESYRCKKKYYRLKSGDFISLGEDDQLASLDDMMEHLELSSEDVIKGKVRLPMFRALYLDKMLEKHDALAADRDRTYRKLLKNFHTIRDADYDPPEGMEEVLRPYQMYGYKWLRTLGAAGFGGILADEMGLGKTLQTIAMITALIREGETMPSLIICPASLVYNWQEEFARFAPSVTVCPVAGNAPARKNIFKEMKKNLTDREALAENTDQEAIAEKADGEAPAKRRGRKKKNSQETAAAPQVYITSYDLLRKDISQYEAMTFSVMVLDEAQYIKNQKAAMTKAVKVVQAKHRFALTGTPIENRLAELWSIFDFLMPGFLYKYDEFAEKYEVPITKGKNEEAAARLKQMVGPFILSRLKTDVLKDLPPKLEEVRYARFEEKQRQVYDGQVVRMKQMIEGTDGNQEDRIRVFAELTRIRQICCDPSLLFEDYDGDSAKRQACMELVKSAIGGGHRILLFSQFTSMLALLEEDLKKEGIAFYKITGATPKDKRIQMVHAFNEDEVPVFLISLKAGGTGLNLTGADVVIHYDPWWNLAAQNQATDRAHRIGQQRQVTVYRLIVKDTIEEKILALQEAKKDLADAILSGEGESIYTLSSEQLLELL